MELQHINFKIFAEHPEQVEQERFMPIFQSWIQDQVCEDLLLDVADYLHVDAGPGIVLVGEAADYCMDNSGHRLGLRYNRKAGLALANQAKLGQALRETLAASQRLEADPRLEGKLAFHRGELELLINDRAIAPNTAATLEACRGELEKFFTRAFGGDKFTLTHNPDPRQRFGVTVKTSEPFNIDTVLQNL